jgi:hypothetical protein
VAQSINAGVKPDTADRAAFPSCRVAFPLGESLSYVQGRLSIQGRLPSVQGRLLSVQGCLSSRGRSFLLYRAAFTVGVDPFFCAGLPFL